MRKRKEMERRVERIERAATAFRRSMYGDAQPTTREVMPGRTGLIAFVNATHAFVNEMAEETQ